MLVRATDVGFDGLKTRDPGDEFEMPEGAKGSWFEPVHPVESHEEKATDEEKAPEPRRRGRPPRAR